MSRLLRLFPVLLLLLGGPAAAGFRICNDSFDVLNVAVGEPYGDGYRSRGWWRIAPSQCATPIREALNARFLYVYAADVFGRAALPGAVQLCVAPRRFVIEGAQDCLLRGYVDAFFSEIDTGGAADWTLYLTLRPD